MCVYACNVTRTRREARGVRESAAADVRAAQAEADTNARKLEEERCVLIRITTAEGFLRECTEQRDRRRRPADVR